MDRRLAKRIVSFILLGGFGAAAVVFVRAEATTEFPLGYDPLTNKKYVLELERYGGKANVATAEFMQWFEGLWHGTHLAYTLAVLTALAAALFWFAATLPPLDDEPPGT